MENITNKDALIGFIDEIKKYRDGNDVISRKYRILGTELVKWLDNYLNQQITQATIAPYVIETDIASPLTSNVLQGEVTPLIIMGSIVKPIRTKKKSINSNSRTLSAAIDSPSKNEKKRITTRVITTSLSTSLLKTGNISTLPSSEGDSLLLTRNRSISTTTSLGSSNNSPYKLKASSNDSTAVSPVEASSPVTKTVSIFEQARTALDVTRLEFDTKTLQMSSDQCTIDEETAVHMGRFYAELVKQQLIPIVHAVSFIRQGCAFLFKKSLIVLTAIISEMIVNLHAILRLFGAKLVTSILECSPIRRRLDSSLSTSLEEALEWNRSRVTLELLSSSGGEDDTLSLLDVDDRNELKSQVSIHQLTILRDGDLLV